ncbi:MAG: hypothetical protein LBM93_14370 [Oscillospiraceae bacterium]|jgi:hypothetical protein|nr:hypothetical protein [Oscillospiraceae bacterium]
MAEFERAVDFVFQLVGVSVDKRKFLKLIVSLKMTEDIVNTYRENFPCELSVFDLRQAVGQYFCESNMCFKCGVTDEIDCSAIANIDQKAVDNIINCIISGVGSAGISSSQYCSGICPDEEISLFSTVLSLVMHKFDITVEMENDINNVMCNTNNMTSIASKLSRFRKDKDVNNNVLVFYNIIYHPSNTYNFV